MEPITTGRAASGPTPRFERLKAATCASALTLVAVALASSAFTADAADFDKPHPHQGVLPKFSGAPPRIVLSEEQQAALARGEAVITSHEGASGGRGFAVQEINAQPDTIWGRIMAFRSYPGMVDHVKECEPYYEKDGDIRVRFIVGVALFDYEYFIKHDFQTADGYATWTLDYSKESDIEDSVGYWSVVPHASKSGWSVFYYSIDMRTRGWMPGFIRSLIANKGLKNATEWVKREAEKAQRQMDTGQAGQQPMSLPDHDEQDRHPQVRQRSVEEALRASADRKEAFPQLFR